MERPEPAVCVCVHVCTCMRDCVLTHVYTRVHVSCVCCAWVCVCMCCACSCAVCAHVSMCHVCVHLCRVRTRVWCVRACVSMYAVCTVHPCAVCAMHVSMCSVGRGPVCRACCARGQARGHGGGGRSPGGRRSTCGASVAFPRAARFPWQVSARGPGEALPVLVTTCPPVPPRSADVRHMSELLQICVHLLKGDTVPAPWRPGRAEPQHSGQRLFRPRLWGDPSARICLPQGGPPGPVHPHASHASSATAGDRRDRPGAEVAADGAGAGHGRADSSWGSAGRPTLPGAARLPGSP